MFVRFEQLVTHVLCIYVLVIVTTAPFQSWSANWGAKSLAQLGHPVSTWAGTASWIGTGVGMAGLLTFGIMMATSEIPFLASFIPLVAGFLGTYIFGAIQWAKNGRAWRAYKATRGDDNALRRAPPMLRVGFSF